MASQTKRQAVTVDGDLLRRLANTVRGLSIDGTQAANSGHPGLPLGAADFTVTLWYHFLRYNPNDPAWPGRDKFILSGGHGSMLIYSMLHLAGYDLPLKELKNFRQWGSKTPGHPESGHTAGVEATTGPLGQGFATGVGFGLADRMMARRYHDGDFTPFDNYIYALVTDGDLMEGVALEAASFAGHMKLGNLIYLYDDNDISLDGPTSLSFDRENTKAKFEATGWHVLEVDGHDHQAVADAIVAAQAETDRPSLICCKTVIGFGSPNKAGTSSAHGSPLGADEARLTKEKLGIPTEPAFHVPKGDYDAWASRAASLKKEHEAWKQMVEKKRASKPKLVAAMEGQFAQKLPAGIEKSLPKFDKAVATRKASQEALTALGKEISWLAGGSADLSCSTNAFIKGDKAVDPGEFEGSHIFFGVREHAMGSIVNGMVLHGAFRGFGATFLTFSDYMRGAVRLSALMECPSIWVYTHDSVFLGEDGPTHQPVEHYAALRAIPNLQVFRPGDADETAWAWLSAVQTTRRPSALLLTRQNLPVYDRTSNEFAPASNVAKGAYVLRKEKDSSKLDGIFIATGSELHLCVEAARELEKEGRSVRVVSAPCLELFADQPEKYQESVLPSACTARVVVESGVTMGWEKYAGDKGVILGINHFGASAPAEVIAEKLGFTVANVAKLMRGVFG
ncbi:MAG: transketolase [Candidatus Sumerlaeia bacterium]|nr:transketolase [Candidatus Sumerlaeia bacterium]